MSTSHPISPDHLDAIFARNLGVIGKQIDGLSHADTLLQPQPRGNCLNWTLGHIAVYRDITLGVLGAESALDPEWNERYGNNSQPVTGDGPNILPLERILATLEDQQGCLGKAIAAATDEQLAAPVKPGESDTIADRVSFYAWHEAYHVGQTEMLRQLAGTDDKVI